jgi:hypothetical protein
MLRRKTYTGVSYYNRTRQSKHIVVEDGLPTDSQRDECKAELNPGGRMGAAGMPGHRPPTAF